MIAQQIERARQEFEQKMQAAKEPARKRLDEINQLRDELDREEADLLRLLNESPAKGGPGAKRTRRSSGKRVTRAHKREIIARFINQGHIKNNGDLTRELRIALSDEGFGPNDFRKMNDYLPSGWTSRSNGARGTAARTTFHTA